MSQKPFFSIIMPHYDQSIPYDRFVRAVSYVLRQSYRNWEMLIYHDGPLADEAAREHIDSLKDPRIKFTVTDERHNDWGHSLRDRGMKEAEGEYIVHLNSDNVIYQNTLAILKAYSEWERRSFKFKDAKGRKMEFVANPDLLVFGIKMMGVLNPYNAPGFTRFRGTEEALQLHLPGWPPNQYKIDAMQLVAKRSLWLDIGGWHDKGEESDGKLIEQLTRKNGYLVVPEVLGEHW